MEEEYFKVKVHHSGKFVKGKKVTYEGKDCRDLNDGLKQLVDDAGALEMIRIAKCEGCVHLYVLHPEIVHHIVGNERNDLPENHIAQDNIPQETPMAEDNVSIQ
ncbi:hypothetical protein GYH30_027179 [Glycine max]|nr:hypothetical protein GYH30_027179 [Glycine max]